MADANISTRERIWSAIQELSSVGKCFTRKRLELLTGLSFGIIDDHCDRFIEQDLIVRIGAGTFEMAKQWRAEIPVSAMPLEDGSLKLEREDDVWHLTPGEARRLAKLLAGYSQELAHLDGQAEVIAAINTVDARTRRTEKRVETVIRSMQQQRRRDHSRQLQLI